MYFGFHKRPDPMIKVEIENIFFLSWHENKNVDLDLCVSNQEIISISTFQMISISIYFWISNSFKQNFRLITQSQKYNLGKLKTKNTRNLIFWVQGLGSLKADGTETIGQFPWIHFRKLIFKIIFSYTKNSYFSQDFLHILKTRNAGNII